MGSYRLVDLFSGGFILVTFFWVGSGVRSCVCVYVCAMHMSLIKTNQHYPCVSIAVYPPHSHIFKIHEIWWKYISQTDRAENNREK